MANYEDQGEYYEQPYDEGDYGGDFGGEGFGQDEQHGGDQENQKLTDFYDRLQGQGLGPKLAAKIDQLHQHGIMTPEELDDRALDALKEFSVEDALTVVDQFAKSDLSHVQNKSAFLCGVMKTYRAKMKIKEAKAETKSSGGGPNEDKIKALLDRTGYTLDITTGQRKYGGPPPNWEGPPPGQGEKRFCAQIFIGKIPRDMFEDELVPIFEEFGTIYDFRLMIDPMSGQNKGYAFCTFTSKEAALSAVKKMDKHEIKPGRKLGVCLSLPNDRLFVGSIPKSKTKKQIFDEFASVTEGLVDIIVYISPEDKNKNRGFAFLQYDTHKSASLARRRLMSGRIKVFGHITPTVDWADPQEEPDDEVMSTVKVVYVRNLSPAIDEIKLSELFKQYGEVEKVKKLKDYAFIHFTERENALRAIEELNGQDLDDLKIEVSLARPQTEKKDSRRRGQSGFGALNDPVSRPGQRGFRGGPRGGPSFGLPPRGRARGGRPGPSERYYEGGSGGGGGGYGNQGGYGGGDYGGYEEDYGYGGGYDQNYEESYGSGSGGAGGGGGGAGGGYGEDSYYDDYYGYNDQSYDNYYSQEPPRPSSRGGTRGGPSGRGAQRMTPRGGRGAPSGRGGREDTGRGGRGAPRGAAMGGRGGSMRGGIGRGGPRGAGSGGPPKRKMENGQGTPQPKRKYGDQGGSWNPQPIAQQPLQQSGDYYGYGSGGSSGQEWYADTYGLQWK